MMITPTVYHNFLPVPPVLSAFCLPPGPGLRAGFGQEANRSVSPKAGGCAFFAVATSVSGVVGSREGAAAIQTDT